MNVEEAEFEDGEVESDEDGKIEPDEVYTPLQRPNNESRYQRRNIQARETDSSDSSDSETPSKRRYTALSVRGAPSDDGGGQVFASLSRSFQNERKRKNNVWGSILEEETLTSELTGIGVTEKRQIPFSDRGAESYDYSLAEEEKKTELDGQLSEYWKQTRRNAASLGETSHKNEPLLAGRKRSVKERLGPRSTKSEDSFDSMSIPPPGIPRIITELSPSIVEEGNFNEISEEMAAKLCEPKTELIEGVLEIGGIDFTLELFNKTREIEKGGGRMIKNGARRRTPGGLFLHLLRESKDDRVDQKAVKELFNTSSKAATQKKKKNVNFETELKEFKDFSDTLKKNEADKPENLSSGDSLSLSSEDFNNRQPEPFVEPEAPPNSVERSTAVYDEDDELHCDTWDIELM